MTVRVPAAQNALSGHMQEKPMKVLFLF